jgi:hypothetical protein
MGNKVQRAQHAATDLNSPLSVSSGCDLVRRPLLSSQQALLMLQKEILHLQAGKMGRPVKMNLVTSLHLVNSAYSERPSALLKYRVHLWLPWMRVLQPLATF